MEFVKKWWWLALLVVALVDGGNLLIQWRRTPSPSQWKQLRATLQKKRQPHEPILVAPEWMRTRAYQEIGELLTLEQASLSDTETVRSAWAIQMGNSVPELLGKGFKSAYHRTFGALALRRYTQSPSSRSVYDFYSRLNEATVRLRGPYNSVPCRKGPIEGGLSPEGFHCTPSKWVGKNLAEVDYQPHHCIQARPIGKVTLEIQYPQSRLGDHLVVYTGIDNFRQRYAADGAVTLKVLTNDNVLGEVVHHHGDGWLRSELKTDPKDKATVTFQVTSTNPKKRHFCFLAESRMSSHDNT